jgi:hypothetical protein
MDKPKPSNLLMQMELEVLEEAREWGRRRLQEKLQKLIDEQGAISPPQRPAAEEGSPPKAEAENGRRRNRR